MTAEQIKKILGLAPHPCEGGWYKRTYASDAEIILPGRYGGKPRVTSTAIYYLLESHNFSEMHRLASDEIFHFYGGDAVEMLQLHETGMGHVTEIGMDLLSGQRPQVCVPRGVWQGSRLKLGGSWALLGCTVSPGFEFSDYEAGTRSGLTMTYPEWKEMIEGLTHH